MTEQLKMGVEKGETTKWKTLNRVWLFATPWTVGILGQNTGVGSLSLLQGIFPIQGSNPGPTLQADSLPAELPGRPKNTGVGSLALLSGSSITRNRTGISCIAGGFFTSWATR